MNENVLSIAVSGLRHTWRTSLYKKLEQRLPHEPTLSGYEFAFIGSPFGAMPHPLDWDGDHLEMSLSRLYACWGKLNDFTELKWLPALQAGKIPVMDGCGLDAVLYAAACIDCQCDDAELLDFHKLLVQRRIVDKGIDPPYYLITNADSNDLTKILAQKIDRLDEVSARQFIAKEKSTIDNYFADGSGQHKPHYLTSKLSLERMTQESVHIIAMRLQNHATKVA